jgi:hypothetical protein
MRDSTLYERVETDSLGHKYITLGTGRQVIFYDAEKKASKHLTDLARWVRRMGMLTEREYQETSLLATVERMEAMAQHWRREMERRQGVATKRQRIAALRDVRGRTPEEAAVYLAKADELEKQL